jgi:hypothetical protein
MRFVLVNGRKPCPQTFCVSCCEPIGASYLREIGTRLSYCDHACYADHCNKAVPALENHALAWMALGFFATGLFVNPANMSGFDFRQAQPESPS